MKSLKKFIVEKRYDWDELESALGNAFDSIEKICKKYKCYFVGDGDACALYNKNGDVICASSTFDNENPFSTKEVDWDNSNDFKMAEKICNDLNKVIKDFNKIEDEEGNSPYIGLDDDYEPAIVCGDYYLFIG